MEKIKILIAEDDKMVRRLYDEAFIEDVFEKQIVSNGEDAFNTYLTWKPEIMILDIMMPLMTGYTVLQKIRKENSDLNTTIIMASSISDKENVVSCLKLGIQGYITKPFKADEIAKRALDYYHQKNAQRAKDAINELKKVKTG